MNKLTKSSQFSFQWIHSPRCMFGKDSGDSALPWSEHQGMGDVSGASLKECPACLGTEIAPFLNRSQKLPPRESGGSGSFFFMRVICGCFLHTIRALRWGVKRKVYKQVSRNLSLL